MKYKIDKESGESAYLQLYRQLRDDIIAGNYVSGSRLPSKRTLSEETGVSTLTAEHAYALLIDEGYVRPRERSGYFVSFKPSDFFAEGGEMRKSDARYSAESPSGSSSGAESGQGGEIPISLLTKTMRRVMSECGEAILKKSPSCGLPQLREAIRRYLAGSRGISVDAGQIVIGSGSEYLYGLIVGLLGRELTYAVEDPSYNKIERVYRSLGVRCELLPLGGDGIESSALWASGADVLHISPYRSFPSGVTASASKRHEYLSWAGARGRYIIEDDFESEFSVSRKPEETLFAGNSRVIYLNTFSRTISPALRVGYMVLPKLLTGIFEEKLGFYSCTVPTFEQLVLTELISGGDFERHINRVRRRKRREAQSALR